ncbi:MAG: ABC transporter ATP-binding protein [Pseudonocardiaceae bacterium]
MTPRITSSCVGIVRELGLEPVAVTKASGKSLQQMSSSTVARELAVLPQAPTAPDTLTVYELVEQGRFPHVGGLRTLGQADRAAILRALEGTHTVELARGTIGELSGGERQRCWTALALAQDTPLLLLDEPTTFLDLHHRRPASLSHAATRSINLSYRHQSDRGSSHGRHIPYHRLAECIRWLPPGRVNSDGGCEKWPVLSGVEHMIDPCRRR